MAFVPSPLGILPEAWGWRGCACKPVHFQPARPSAESRASLLPSFLLFRCPFSPPVLHAHHHTAACLHPPHVHSGQCHAAGDAGGCAEAVVLAATPLWSSAFAERRRGVPSNFSLARPPHRTPHAPHHTLTPSAPPTRPTGETLCSLPVHPVCLPKSPYTTNFSTPPSKNFSTTTMRECISIHVGQGGIQTGNACWELYWYVLSRGGGAVR